MNIKCTLLMTTTIAPHSPATRVDNRTPAKYTRSRLSRPSNMLHRKNNYKKLFLDGPTERPYSSPRSVASSDHSSTQSPPSAWNLPPQSESSAHAQNGRLEPGRTAEFGAATLSRLPLAPPIVVQLIVRDRFGNSIIPEVELPFLIAHLSLYSDDGTRSLDMGRSPGSNSPPRRLLYGNLVSSPQKLRDLSGRLGLYFLFPDVSIRWRGRFQLGSLAVTTVRVSVAGSENGGDANLVCCRRIDASGAMSLASEGIVLAAARTRPFDVLTHENYVAPPTTRLTQSFLRQGARIHAFPPNTP
ncbi:velvet factor-domain-containing protein [Pisolithus microcarpus]|nr:velvet factor-domain-containing protein [Pisolithus microcarpus]